ncbi:methyl-accepting chemotaxis protein [Barrientosiimonas marina]|uniref:Methyl-accepting chemotaxis protein n=1 Tax=Lentibacillus kimchii TaxID=1542911 RepID=A0ABW2UYK2_9BACI
MYDTTTDAQSEQTILDAFIKAGPLLNQLTQDDITVGIYDTEKLIINYPGNTFSLNVNPGDPLADGDVITHAIKENKPKTEIVPKELFGFPLIARAVPVHDEQGTIVGGIGIGTSLEEANKLHEVAENLSASVEESAASVEEITSSISELADQVTGISSQMTQVNDSTNKIGDISKVVKGISEQTNLLGLNASIEAARAGEYGNGFNVVAEEIRKLASNSKENVTEIDKGTQEIQNLIKELDNAFSNVHEMSDSQAAAIQEISSTIQEISSNAQDLAKMAEKQLQTDRNSQ